MREPAQVYYKRPHTTSHAWWLAIRPTSHATIAISSSTLCVCNLQWKINEQGRRCGNFKTEREGELRRCFSEAPLGNEARATLPEARASSSKVRGSGEKCDAISCGVMKAVPTTLPVGGVWQSIINVSDIPRERQVFFFPREKAYGQL